MMYVTLEFRKKILIVNYKCGIHCINAINICKTTWMDGRTDRSKKKEKELWKESTQGSDKQKGMDSRGGDRMGKQNQEDILSKRK